MSVCVNVCLSVCIVYVCVCVWVCVLFVTSLHAVLILGRYVNCSVVCHQGKEVIEYYINELISEGITYIPPWADPHPKTSLPQPPQEDAPSQDSGLRSRSNSVASVHSQNSLVLGATAATIHNTGIPEIHEPGTWHCILTSCMCNQCSVYYINSQPSLLWCSDSSMVQEWFVGSSMLGLLVRHHSTGLWPCCTDKGACGLFSK